MTSAQVILDKDYIIAPIDEKVFSSFVEPLGRCVYGGIYDPGHHLADENGFRKDVLELTKPLHLTLNRFPGGNFISTYRWEDGIGPKERRPRRVEVAWQCIETNEFGLDEFAKWSKLNGSDVMMTVNLATRGVLEAMDCLEYCNFPSGTYWSDLRKSYGNTKPYGYTYWCLTNEIDGVWQVGQKTGSDYGKLAREASKGMKLIDPNIKTVLAGSSSSEQPTFPSFDAEALDEAYDFIDYLSIHQYLGNSKNDTPSYLAKPMTTDAYLDNAIAVCDYVKAKKHSNKVVNISFDEFNTWHSITEEERFLEPWRIAPPLLEDLYTMEDALVLGSMFLAVLRHADRVKIACVSELVNSISHIRTASDGKSWVLPPYYTFLHFSQFGRGTAMRTIVNSPKYDSKEFLDVPYVDAQAVITDDETVVLFAINRSLSESLMLQTKLRGFDRYLVEQHIVLTSGNPKDTNTQQDPWNVKPSKIKGVQMEGEILETVLPKLSWNVIVLKKVK